MSRRVYIEASATGRPQFVSAKRSRSHGHRHRHHRHAHVKKDYYRVSVDEWNRTKERERCLEDTNRSLAAQVAALKSSLATSQAEAHRLCHVVVPQLQKQVNLLAADNDALRKSLENASHNEGKHCRDEEKLKHAAEKLEKEKKELKDENCSLKDKIKHLQRQVEQGCGRKASDLFREIEYWRDQYRYWKRKYEDSKAVQNVISDTLDVRTEKMKAYEEILRRRQILKV
ncbi:uncharacterized protein UV8b_06154 [Ustilaginoidea virens]|uniref:Uncharacterized protein n=1 Tax=Ustilaginoidea virens TaxID=1159556 RepID=A0A063C9U8_USTVR|nr:uncharacterized protein UV8b_06154 [Ustilaginoidea virens]QUC21913.1 hypothetical protein UV8b_06154 [Ustilaginoidea virens]GAO16522.1 hypothetical protein UVI_02023940 [Ustilaginoidea virens]